MRPLPLLLALAIGLSSLSAAFAQDDAAARDKLIRRHEQVIQQERLRQEQIQREREARREDFRKERDDMRDSVQRRAAEREAEADRERYRPPPD